MEDLEKIKMILKDSYYVIATRPRFKTESNPPAYEAISYDLPIKFLSKVDGDYKLVDDITQAFCFTNKSVVSATFEILRKDFKKGHRNGNSNVFMSKDGFVSIDDPYYLVSVNGLVARNVVRSFEI